jgi:hypothetical protein
MVYFGRIGQRWLSEVLGQVLVILLTLTVVTRAGAADLVFVEDNSFLENGYKYVEGVVKNTGTKIIKIITVTVKFYNKDRKFLRFAQTFANPAYLLPEQEGFFKICIPNDPEIKGYSIHADYDLEEK